MRNSKVTSRTRRPCFETMEARHALASDVIGMVTNGNLYLTGDDAGNTLTISQALNANGAPISGSYTVSGSGATAGDTTINRRPTQTFSGVTGSLIVDLKGGNDRLVISNDPGMIIPAGSASRYSSSASTQPGPSVAWQGNVQVNLGAGADYLGLHRVNIAGNFSATGSLGAKNVVLMRTNIAGDLSVQTGASDDMIALALTQVGRNVGLQTGAGNDQLKLSGLSAAAISVDTGAGSDRVALSNSQAGNVTLLAGDGNDDFTIDRLNVTNSLFAALGSGDDTFRIGGSSAATASIAGDSGLNQFLEDGASANAFGSLTLSGFGTSSATTRAR